MSTLHRHKKQSDIFQCPSCSTSAFAQYRYDHDKGEAFIYRCPNCTLEFLRPLVLSEINERKMESIADAELFNSPFLRTLHTRLIIEPEIRKVRKLLKKNDFEMLDIGCGTGWISKHWADSGASVTGLEPSHPRAELARQRGVNVLSCYAEEWDSDKAFDLIVIRHLIEHLEDPATLLRSLSSRLKPNGLLLIIAPNIECIGRKIFDINWEWVLPCHCNYFSPRSLGLLLENCGYEIAKKYQTPSPLYYSGSFARRFPRLGKILQMAPLSMLLFTPLILLGFLTKNSDNVTILAHKRTN